MYEHSTMNAEQYGRFSVENDKQKKEKKITRNEYTEIERMHACVCNRKERKE